MVLQTIPEFRLPGNNEQTAFLNRRAAAETCLEQDVHAFAWAHEDIDPHHLSHLADTPGAYRYDPADHDPTIPESDPRSPRYEPPHLRHQSGDTWIIDRARPYDPDDPGPYGSPGWYQDTRTGRHRRGERPDPLPETSQDTGPNRPRPGPRREGRWQVGQHEETEPRLPAVALESAEAEQFSSLREGAWYRFLSGSQILHETHYSQSEPARERLIALLRNLLDLILRLLGLGGRTPEPDRDLAPGVPEAGRALAAGRAAARVYPPAAAPYIAQWERQFDSAAYVRQEVIA